MSWSVYAKGKPAAVKKVVLEQFATAKESTKQVPHEHASVALLEEIVEGSLNFLVETAPDVPVDLEASGSASAPPAGAAWKGSSTTHFSLKQIHGWVE